MEAKSGSPGIEPGQPGIIDEFNVMLEEFYNNLENKKIHAAKLNYEEMKHTYDYMESQDKHEVYEKLMQAFDDISTLENMK